MQRYDTCGWPWFVERPDGTLMETAYVGLIESVHYDAKRARKRQICVADDRPVAIYADVDEE